MTASSSRLSIPKTHAPGLLLPTAHEGHHGEGDDEGPGGCAEAVQLDLSPSRASTASTETNSKGGSPKG